MSEEMVRNGALLIAEDDEDIAASLEMILEGEGYSLTIRNDGVEALEAARESDFDAVLTDYRLPGMGGMDLLDRLREDRPGRPVVLMTGHGSTELAIEATKRGAFDYLLKPFDIEELTDTVAKAVRAGRNMQKKVRLGAKMPESETRDTAMIGESRVMQSVYKDIGRIAPTNASVLILGETGTGKELVARALYQHGNRSDQPFIAVNCGAIPENLLESELFGHEKGAFTGAVSARLGRFEQADGGTLFLDEIGDMPMAIQVKLLRVLQDGSFQPLGGAAERRADVRVIAATHQDIEKLIEKKAFREDLFFRLSPMRISVPPLRERTGDIEMLVEYFTAAAAAEYDDPPPAYSKEVMRVLLSHRWPGNVRQLQNVIRYIVLNSGGFGVTADLVEDALSSPGYTISKEKGEAGSLPLEEHVRRKVEKARRSGRGRAHAELIAEAESQLIRAALQLSGGHLGKVTEWLGISRVTLRKKMAEHDLKARADF